MKRTIVVVLFISALFAQNRNLTLEESVRIGLENSKNIKISQAAVKIAESKITQASSYMLPQLSFNASYARLSDVKPFEVNVPISPNPIKIQDPILNNYNLQLSLQQPIFTGFKLSSLKNAAEFNKKSTEEEYQKEINEEAMNIHSAFWSLYKAEIILNLIKENLKSLEKHLSDTRNFLDNGLATKNDLLKLEVQYSNVELRKLEAANNLEIARAAFNKTIGVELSKNTTISADNSPQEMSEFNYNVILQEALNNRNEIKSLKSKIEAGNESITAAKSGWFPSVYLFGNFYYSNPNQRIMPLEDKFNDTWDLGVSLKWNIWDWGNRSAQTTEAEQRVLTAETAMESVKEGIQLEVYKNYLQLKNEKEKVEVSRRSVNSAEENYRVTAEKYNEQLASSSELIDAEVYLLDAKVNLEKAIVDYKLAQVSLKKSIGRRIY